MENGKDGRRHVAPASQYLAQLRLASAVDTEYRRRLQAAGVSVVGDEVLVYGRAESTIVEHIWQSVVRDLELIVDVVRRTDA